MRPPKAKALRAVRPNAGISAAYRRRLKSAIAAMAASYERWLPAQWRENTPEMAMDASAARDLERELRRLGDRWQSRFDELAPRLARWFLQSTSRRSDAALRKILRDGGMTVKFTMTPSMRDAIDAIVAENVSLVKSIPAQYHAQVSGAVMRSVTAGRDLAQLSKDLRKQFGVTERRAAFIALDQSNKTTSALMRVRQTDMGIQRGVWLHSHAGKEPRPTHLANHGKEFDLKIGWYDPDPKVREHILPGQLVRCRCVWKPLVRGFS
jgi:SPP1 gp7 family putative phage head morphogenesis protein